MTEPQIEFAYPVAWPAGLPRTAAHIEALRGQERGARRFRLAETLDQNPTPAKCATKSPVRSVPPSTYSPGGGAHFMLTSPGEGS